MDSLADTQLLLQDVVAALVRAVDPEKVILFGSRARGDAAEDSDIDLFLEVKTGRDTGRLAEQSYRAIHRLKDRPPVGIDVVVKDTAYVERFSDSVGTVVRVSLAGANGSSRPEAASDDEFDGTVSEVSRMVSSDSHDFLVKIELPSTANVRSGMYGKARFETSTRPGLAVPTSALVRRGQLAFVYVVERDNRAHLRMVNAGEPSDGFVEIRSGLLQGERVVATLPPALTDGSPVTAGAR